MTEYWSYILAPFGLLGMWVTGKKLKWGWLLSTATQVLWLAYAINTRQWGFIPGTCAYAYVYIRNYLRWRKDEKA